MRPCPAARVFATAALLVAPGGGSALSVDKTAPVEDGDPRRGKDESRVDNCRRARKGPKRQNQWKDKDFTRSCKGCKTKGLRFRNRTGLCEQCYKALPPIAKACRGDLRLAAVVEHYKVAMKDLYGVERAAELLGVDPAEFKVRP